MATSRKRNVEIDVIVDDSQKGKLKGIGDEATKTGKGFSGLAGNMKLAVAAGAALVATKIVDFLGDSARAAAEDDKSQRLLALALENTTGATKGQIAELETWIDGMARATGVADDQLRPALANLVRASGDTAQSQKDLGVALDIAAAKGLDLETVTKAMAKAQAGNTGAFGKLGVAVKDANGDLLTYEEILVEASRTMGGAASEASASLSGQLERQKVAWEETQEEVGRNVIPVLSHVGGLLGVLAAEFGPAAEQSIARINVEFNKLVNSGVDPASDSVGAFVTILGRSEDTAAATTESVEFLRGMLGLTTEDYLEASKRIEENADALGLNGDEVANLTGLLSVHTGEVAKGRGAIERHTDAIEDNIAATEEQVNQTREMVDPLFALFGATERATTAEVRYNEAVKTHGVYSREATTAGIDLAKAQLDLNAASAAYAIDGGPGSINTLRMLLEEAGLLPDAIQKIIDRVNLLNATPVKNAWFAGRGDVGTGNAPRAAGGPIMAGQTVTVGEAGPERITLGTQANVTPNHRLGNGGTEIIQVVLPGIGVIAEAIRRHDRSLLPR